MPDLPPRLVVPAPVVHAVTVAVPEQGVVGGEVSLPGSVVHQDHLPALGLVELEARVAGQRLDQEPIHQRFQP